MTREFMYVSAWDAGEVDAYDARSGQLLWPHQPGSGHHSNPVSRAVNGMRATVAVSERPAAPQGSLGASGDSECSRLDLLGVADAKRVAAREHT